MKKHLVIIGIVLVLIAAGLSGCSEQKSNNSKNIPPTVSISANPTSGTVPLTVLFIGIGNDPDGIIESYNWDFGDGNTSIQQNPSHTFTSAGTYLISLIVTDDGGLTAKASTTIKVVQSLEEITLINHCSAYIKVYVETETDNGKVEKSCNLDSYGFGDDWHIIIDLEQKGLFTGGDVKVTVTAYRGPSPLTYLSTKSVNSGGYQGIVFTFNDDGTINHEFYKPSN